MNEKLLLLICIILGWMLCKHMGNGFSVGAQSEASLGSANIPNFKDIKEDVFAICDKKDIDCQLKQAFYYGNRNACTNPGDFCTFDLMEKPGHKVGNSHYYKASRSSCQNHANFMEKNVCKFDELSLNTVIMRDKQTDIKLHNDYKNEITKLNKIIVDNGKKAIVKEIERTEATQSLRRRLESVKKKCARHRGMFG